MFNGRWVSEFHAVGSMDTFFFGADGPCGQSPEMWFGLSMVETLLITLGAPLIVLSLLGLCTYLSRYLVTQDWQKLIIKMVDTFSSDLS